MKYPPIIIEDNNKRTKPLIQLKSNEKHFDEAWLQELIFTHPKLLPCGIIDENYERVIPIGREIPVTSGFIDNLYVTHEGRLVVVETKLWRNPDAHRTVLAQIIDYAKDLANIEFAELQDKIKRFYSGRGKKINGIYDLVKPALANKDLDDIAFEQSLRRSLGTGDFLLLIVGDQIRPEVAMLSEVLQVAPHLEFTLGLVEIRFYRIEEGDWPLLAVPAVVGRTHEVTRGVVRIRYEQQKPPEVSVTTFEPTAVQSSERTNPETFLKSIPSEMEDTFRAYLDKWKAGPFYLYWGKLGFSLRLKKDGKYKSIIDAYPDCISIFKKDWLKEWGNPVETYQRYRQSLNDIEAVISVITSGKRYIYYKNLTVENLKIILQTTDILANELNDYVIFGETKL